jgi:hypothetical protein
MCPEPALLVAYLDGTLFSRDKDAIDAHLANCEQCTALLVSMRQVRAAEESKRSHRWKALAGGIVVGVIGIGVWTLRSTPTVAPAPAPEPTAGIREIAPPAPPSPSPSPAATARPAGSATPTPKPKPAPPKPKPVPVETKARIQWRTNERVVERSTDGGMTWTTEYTADRPIRASAFVNDEVAWVVGENGLLLRRTKNGWFGASPPADGHITAVRASSPSRATVTLDDGRVFTTQNGGVTWSSP